ncbi:MAG: leucine-rich repeat domain-containing protein [Verrucomicrobiota bacterium]
MNTPHTVIRRGPRRLLEFACVLLAWLPVLPVKLQAQFAFVTNNDAVTITGYTGSGGALKIPSTINGLTVTAIDDFAFAGLASLTSVTIGTAVTYIGFAAFSGCTGLANFTVDTLNPAYRSLDGVLFNKNKDTLVAYPAGKGGDYVAPNGTTSIGAEAFFGCTALTSVTLPGSVTNIGEGAFEECTGLTSVPLGSGVASLGLRAFANCTALTSVVIPLSVTNLVANYFKFDRFSGSFAGCTSLTNITVDPRNTTYSSLDGVMFNQSRDTLITYPPGNGGDYIVPNSVTTIAGGAFGGCTRLTGVSVGSGVACIGGSAFAGCTGLSSVAIPNSVTSIGYVAFLRCSGLTNITIGNSVTNIADQAFSRCTGLSSVTIPKSVTNIGSGVFEDCTGLRSVFFAGNAPTQVDYWDPFLGASSLTVYYLAGNAAWGPTFAGRPAVLWNPVIQVGDASFGVRSHGFGFNIVGTRNNPVVVEASSSLAESTWVPLQTLTLTNGLVAFADSAWTNHPARFYRLRAP